MKKRKTSDPILEKFASNFELSEDGFVAGGEGSRRSEFEKKKLDNMGSFDAKKFEPSKHQKKGFDQAGAFEGKKYDPPKGSYFDGDAPSVQTDASGLTGQEAKDVSGQSRMAEKAYRTDAYQGQLGEYQTSENLDIQRRRGSMPDPKIIRNSNDPISVEEVRELLNRK